LLPVQGLTTAVLAGFSGLLLVLPFPLAWIFQGLGFSSTELSTDCDFNGVDGGIAAAFASLGCFAGGGFCCLGGEVVVVSGWEEDGGGSLAAMTSVYVGSSLGVIGVTGGVGSSNDVLSFVRRKGGAPLGMMTGEEYAGGPSDDGVSDGVRLSNDGLEEVATSSTTDVGQLVAEGRRLN